MHATPTSRTAGKTKRTGAALAAGATVATMASLLAPVVAGAAHAPGSSEVYTASLTELNGSGTTAEVVALRNGATVTLTMEVSGAAANLPHPQHIHGSIETGGSCPTAADDTDEDGFVSVVEGVPRYGGIQASLSTGPDFTPAAALTGPFPSADADGNYTYTETFTLPDATAAAFDNFHVVIHGIDIDGSNAYDGDKKSSLTDDLPFEVTVPAACGELKAQEPAEMAQSYTGTLGSLNDSGTTADVAALRIGNEVTVAMNVSGAAAGLPHPQHVHGALGTTNECPPPSADVDKDGFVSVAEGVPFYGGIQSTLSTGPDYSASAALTGPFPTADDDGNYSYLETFAIAPEQARDFGNLHVVIHGIDIDDSSAYDGDKKSSLTDDLPFEVTVPAACGQMKLSKIGLSGSYANASGTPGSIVRQYVTLLDREPDATGFDYFATEIANGASLEDLAWSVASSTEFKARFGGAFDASSDADWVDFVYTAVFERPADTAGKDYWLAELAAGRVDRVTMLVYFGESTEFKAVTQTS